MTLESGAWDTLLPWRLWSWDLNRKCFTSMGILGLFPVPFLYSYGLWLQFWLRVVSFPCLDGNECGWFFVHAFSWLKKAISVMWRLILYENFEKIKRLLCLLFPMWGNSESMICLPFLRHFYFHASFFMI